MGDRDQITALVHRYGALLDAGDIDGVVAMFSHATWRSAATGAVLRTPEEIRAVYDNIVLHDGAPRTRHLMTNVVQAVAVTLGLLVVLITDEVAFDGVIAFALGCYLLWIAGGILKTSVGDVLDASLDDDEVEQLRQTIADAAGNASAFHDLRTRRTGQVRHIDFHMTFPGDMTVEESHAIINRVEARIEAFWPGSVINVHAEPLSEAPKEPPL